MPTNRPPGFLARILQRVSDGASQPPSDTVTLLVRSTAVLILVLWLLNRAPGWLAMALTLIALGTWSRATKESADSSLVTRAKLPEDGRTADLTAHDSRSPQLPETFAFEYCDAEGSITQRTVIIRSAGISSSQQRYLSGTCTQAHAQRTFRLDRISGWLERTSDGVLFDAQAVYKAAGPPEAVETNPANFKRSSTTPPPRPWQPAVVFAGFSAGKREELEALAEAAGWQVRTSISKTVTYLVAGGRVGSRQIDRAGELGVQLLDEDEFRMMV